MEGIYFESGYLAEYQDGTAIVLLPGGADVHHRDLDSAWRWCTAEGIRVLGVMRVLEGEGSGWGRAA